MVSIDTVIAAVAQLVNDIEDTQGTRRVASDEAEAVMPLARALGTDGLTDLCSTVVADLEELSAVLTQARTKAWWALRAAQEAKGGRGPSGSAAAPTNLHLLDGGGLPRTLETVRRVAALIDVDTSTARIRLVDDREEARYLDVVGECALTPSEYRGGEVVLGPAAFANEETLAAALARAYVHVAQSRRGGLVGTHILRALETEACAHESLALDRLRRNA